MPSTQSQPFAIRVVDPTTNSARFPRLGGMLIGGGRDYGDPDYAARIAKHHFVVLGTWRDFRTSTGNMTLAELVAHLRTLNPDLRIANYMTVSSATDEPTGAQSDMRDKLYAEVGPPGATRTPNDWWAYDADGNKIPWQSSGKYQVNHSSLVTPDANGDRYPQWKAKRDFDVFLDGTGVDMLYIDNFRGGEWFGGGADYYRDGTLRPRAERDALYREAFMAFLAELRALTGNQLPAMVNATEWINYGYDSLDPQTDPYEPDRRDFFQLHEGGFMEGMHGVPFAFEGTVYDGSANAWGSWGKMMKQYYNCMRWTQGRYCMLHWACPSDAYQRARYGLTSCLLDDAYFTCSPDSYGDIHVFDEYDLDLGQPVDPSMTEAREAGTWGPWQAGVYRREFEQGLVLCYPRTESTTESVDLNPPSATVTLEAGWRRFAGTQDPVTNDGQPVTELTLQRGDGIILVPA